MEFIYWFFVKLYGLFIFLAQPFNVKAKEWIKGRRNYFGELSVRLPSDEKRIWFHCSSLGEFEQGKPVIERLRLEYPSHKILLTFFSPSGYLIKKADPSADYIFYLPLDGPFNCRRFIETVNPAFAVFVKYEFWHFYIKELHKKNIPVFVISAVFRPSQIFFKPYGRFFYKILQRLAHLFVQDQASFELLKKKGLLNASVSGDTRFDRVMANRLKKIDLPIIQQFKNNQQVLIAGSTWPADEQIIIQLINSGNTNWKYIIAPHEINQQAIKNLCNQIKQPTILYSTLKSLNDEKIPDGKQVLIIDNIGILSSLYGYGDAAYIGGGFGAGIHNILEAAVFGLPVFFGPNYQKFNEAKDLVKLKTAFVITDFPSLLNSFNLLVQNPDLPESIAVKNREYVEAKCGATNVVINHLQLNLKGYTQ